MSDKDCELVLIKEIRTSGSEFNIDGCNLPDPNIGYEIDNDVILTGLCHVEGSGIF